MEASLPVLCLFLRGHFFSFLSGLLYFFPPPDHFCVVYSGWRTRLSAWQCRDRILKVGPGRVYSPESAILTCLVFPMSFYCCFVCLAERSEGSGGIQTDCSGMRLMFIALLTLRVHFISVTLFRVGCLVTKRNWPCLMEQHGHLEVLGGRDRDDFLM